MATLTIRLPDDKHDRAHAPLRDRLKQLAESRGISINKLMDEFCTKAISEFDTYNRFQVMAMKGNPEMGLRLLEKLDSLN